MKKEDLKLMLICFPFKKEDNLTKGKPANCVKCNALVWASDSTFKRMKDNFPQIDFLKNPVEIMCMACASAQVALNALVGIKTELQPPTSEQWAEIRELIKIIQTQTNGTV